MFKRSLFFALVLIMYALVISSCSSEEEEMIRNPRASYLMTTEFDLYCVDHFILEDSNRMTVSSMADRISACVDSFKKSYPYDLPYKNYMDSLSRCDTTILKLFKERSLGFQADIQHFDELFKQDSVGHGIYTMTIVPKLIRYTSMNVSSMIVYGDTIVINYSK